MDRARPVQWTARNRLTCQLLVGVPTAARMVFLLLAVVLAGCDTYQLTPSPNLYSRAKYQAFGELPASLESPTVQILYGTDRGRVVAPDGAVSYNADRNSSLSIGVCDVTIGGSKTTWKDLVADMDVPHRASALSIGLGSIDEWMQLPTTPYKHVDGPHGIEMDPEERATLEGQLERFKVDLARRLAASPRKEAVLFIHGFNNSFEDAAIRTAEISNILGREFVPILYSWPAGSGGGLLRSYQHDIESAEFTIYHFKTFMRAIADTPGLERLHIIAHSRGNVMFTSAMRELFIEEGGIPKAAEFLKRYKIHNAILAAADLDLQVAEQRVTAEGVGLGVDRVTIYICAADRAIDLADWLFESLARLGQLPEADLERLRGLIPNVRGLAVVDARVHDGFLTHSYFLDNPAASSDLALTIRYDRDPGVENGRPLKSVAPNYWVIEPDYPVFPPPPAENAAPAATQTPAQTGAAPADGTQPKSGT